MTSPRVSPVALLIALAGLALPASAAAIPQTYVSGVGDDARACTVGAPCKTWAGAISKTDAGGTMTALDSAGYGALTITKSVTIDGAGHLASSLASGSNDFIVNGAGIEVVIKRVNLDYTGICAAGTLHGIRFLRGRSLTVEGVVVQGFPGAGLSVETADSLGSVVVRDSQLVNNCTAGVATRSTAPTGTTRCAWRAAS